MGVGKGVKIIAADCRWTVCAPILANKTVADAVYAIGTHYPIVSVPPRWGQNSTDVPAPAECYELKKPLWTSEGWLYDIRNDYRCVACSGFQMIYFKRFYSGTASSKAHIRSYLAVHPVCCA